MKLAERRHVSYVCESERVWSSYEKQMGVEDLGRSPLTGWFNVSTCDVLLTLVMLHWWARACVQCCV